MNARIGGDCSDGIPVIFLVLSFFLFSFFFLIGVRFGWREELGIDV